MQSLCVCLQFVIFQIINCKTVCLYLVLNRIGNLLAYVAAIFVTSVCRLLSLSGWRDSAWDPNPRDCSRSQIRKLHVAKFLLLRGLFLFFLIQLDRAAFWSCSGRCLRSTASPLCLFQYLVSMFIYYIFKCGLHYLAMFELFQRIIFACLSYTVYCCV